MSTPALALEEVSLVLGGFALRDISLSVAPGEILVLLGANGAGKSVILETIAGFHRPTQGRILIDGRDVTTAPPERRRVGYVFQNFALFPHLTVAQNVRFALRASRAHVGHSPAQSETRVSDLLEQFGLSAFAARLPQDLSGGEKQRVALARALAMDPAVFLFDEPFSALDSATRDTLRDELTDFMRHAHVPAIYVTHDQSEALALADRIAMVDEGAILQVGPAEEVFAAPINSRAARLVGVENLIDGQVSGVARDRISIRVGRQTFEASTPNPPLVVGQPVVIALRGEDIALASRDDPLRPDSLALFGRVVRLTRQGPMFRVSCDCGFAITAYVTKVRQLELGLEVGSLVAANITLSALRVLFDEAPVHPRPLSGHARRS